MYRKIEDYMYMHIPHVQQDCLVPTDMAKIFVIAYSGLRSEMEQWLEVWPRMDWVSRQDVARHALSISGAMGAFCTG